MSTRLGEMLQQGVENSKARGDSNKAVALEEPLDLRQPRASQQNNDSGRGLRKITVAALCGRVTGSRNRGRSDTLV